MGMDFDLVTVIWLFVGSESEKLSKPGRERSFTELLELVWWAVQ